MRQMKDSGIEWIGKIPETWNLKRLVSQLIEIKEKNNPLKTDKVLSLTIKDGVIPYEEKGDVGNKSKENHEEYKLAYPNTIVLNSMNILIGAVGISNYYGCVSPVYYVFKNRDSSNLRFINYIMSSTPFQKYLRKYANGILEIRLRISAEDILKRQIPTPDFNVQQRIADYLDEKCGEIDSLIALQEQMIEKLKAYKQSVITEAVTKGLDPNTKLVPSGIDWIGEIPEGWKLPKTLYTLEMPITDGPHTTPELYESGIPFVSAEAVSCGNGGIDFDHIRGFISQEFYEECCLKYIPQIGDVYMIKSGATTGKVSIVDTDKVFTIWSPLAVFRSNRNIIIPRFLLYTLQGDYFQKQISLHWTFGTQQNIGMRTLEQLLIVLPPLSEQQSIASYLDSKCSDIDRLIALKQRKIESLKDYKKSVIYEAVTGKTTIE